jgi:lipoprotein NlpI
LKSAPPGDGSEHIPSIALIAFVLLGLVATAGAQSRVENWSRCLDPNADVRIGGCTALIQSGAGNNLKLADAFFNRGAAYYLTGQYDRAIQDYGQAIRLKPDFVLAFLDRGLAYYTTGQYDRAIQDYGQVIRQKPDLAMAFNNRGYAYDAKGQYDRAIQDYDKAIHLKPDFASAFVDRGIAYYHNGQYDSALQDYDQAIRLRPDLAVAFKNRGIARFYLARFPDAAADFQTCLGLSPSDADTVLWQHLARKKAGQDDAQGFALQARHINSAKWPAPVVNLFLGRLTPEQTLAAASNPDSIKPDSIKEGMQVPVVLTAQQQHCQAEFFVGEYFLLRQEKSNALAHFRTVRDTCPHYLQGYPVATAEMARLGAGQ